MSEVPGPLNRFGFEVIAERPIPEHFEKRVVVGVVADILQVIVFAAGADAFLGIGGPGRVVGGFFGCRGSRARTGSCPRW